MRSVSRRWLVLALSGALAVAACGGAEATPAPTQGGEPTAAPTDGGGEPSPTDLAGETEFAIAFTSPGLSSAPFLAAIDALNQEGYNITTQVLDQSELVTEGVAKGDFAFGSGANNSILAAVEQGANLRAIVARVQNEWTLYAANDIQECADLGGRRVAIHSQGAVSTAMVRNYINENCPGTEPDYVVIEGSPNRVAALLAGQIDASPLELGDGLTIEEQAGDRFSLLTSFAADLPDLQTTSVYTNAEWAQENASSVVAVVDALLDQFEQIEGNPDYLRQIAEEFVPDAINPDTIEAQAEKYVELEMFPTDGGITRDKLEYTAEFFGPDGTGATSEVIPLEEWADLSYLDLALEME